MKTLPRITRYSMIAFPLLAVSFILIAFTPRIESVEFAEKEFVMYIGETEAIEAKVIPSEAVHIKYEIISSDDSIVSVSDKTLVARSEGTAEIIAKKNNKIYGSCQVEVKPVLPTEIKFDNEIIELGVSRNYSPQVNFFPENTTDKAATYSSLNSEIVAIENGKLHAVSVGKTIITASHSSGLKCELEVNVVPVEPKELQLTGPNSILVGETKLLEANFVPTDVTDKALLWSSSDRSVVSVKNGEITGNSVGTADILIKHSSGAFTKKTIEVMPILATSLILSIDETNSIYQGESVQVSTKISPENTTDKTLKWESSDPSIAIVKNGRITGVAAGTAQISAMTASGIQKWLNITVKPTTKTMTVTITCTCNDYNHVGNEWGTYFSVNGTQVSSGNSVNVTLNKKIKVYSEIVEYDKYCDVGTAPYSMVVNEEYFEYGFYITQTIYVREGNGRYSGNVAEWTVEYLFS